MKKKNFLNEIKEECSEILYISIEHILNKVFKEDDTISKEIAPTDVNAIYIC